MNCYRCNKAATKNVGGLQVCNACDRLEPSFLKRFKLVGWLPWLAIALVLPGCSWFQRKPQGPPQYAEFRGKSDEGFCRYEQLMARVYLEASKRIRSGAIPNENAEQKFIGDRWVESRDLAFTGAMEAEESALGGGKWTAEVAAAYWESLAYECDPSLKGQP